jgi:hypothetical protein
MPAVNSAGVFVSGPDRRLQPASAGFRETEALTTPLRRALSVRAVALGSPEANPGGSSRCLRATALELSVALWRNLRLVNRRGGRQVRFVRRRDGQPAPGGTAPSMIVRTGARPDQGRPRTCPTTSSIAPDSRGAWVRASSIGAFAARHLFDGSKQVGPKSGLRDRRSVSDGTPEARDEAQESCCDQNHPEKALEGHSEHTGGNQHCRCRPRHSVHEKHDAEGERDRGGPDLREARLHHHLARSASGCAAGEPQQDATSEKASHTSPQRQQSSNQTDDPRREAHGGIILRAFSI